MGAASIVAAVGFGAAAFMLSFLMALLREGAPSVGYRVVPVHWKLEKEKDLEALDRIYVDETCRATEANRSPSYRGVLEKEKHDEGRRGQGLIAIDVRNVSGGADWRAINAQHNVVLGQRRFWFDGANRTTGNAG
jgi:hypothetical protein